MKYVRINLTFNMSMTGPYTDDCPVLPDGTVTHVTLMVQVSGNTLNTYIESYKLKKIK